MVLYLKYLRHNSSVTAVDWWIHEKAVGVGISIVYCFGLPVVLGPKHVGNLVAEGVVADGAVACHDSQRLVQAD